MRHYPDRVKVTWNATEVVHESLPCRFGFLDTMKNEALFGAQLAFGSLYIPLTYPIPEAGTERNLALYRFWLVSPVTEPIKRNVGEMVVNQVKIGRDHQYFIVEINQPSTAEV